MELFVKKYQNMNKGSKAYGKWFGRAVYTGTVGIEQIAEKMQSNCTVKRADILAVLSELGPTIKDMLQASQRVKVPYLGLFRLGVSTIGEDDKDEFSLRSNIKSVHVNFVPEGSIDRTQGKIVREMVRGCKLSFYPEAHKDEQESGNDSTETQEP